MSKMMNTNHLIDKVTGEISRDDGAEADAGALALQVFGLTKQLDIVTQAKKKAVTEALDLAAQLNDSKLTIKKLEDALIKRSKEGGVAGAGQVATKPPIAPVRHDFATAVPQLLRENVKRVNKDFLLLARDVSQHDPAAAVTLGIPPETVKLIATLTERQIQSMADKDILFAVPRIKAATSWRDFINSDFSGNALMSLLLREG